MSPSSLAALRDELRLKLASCTSWQPLADHLALADELTVELLLMEWDSLPHEVEHPLAPSLTCILAWHSPLPLPLELEA